MSIAYVGSANAYTAGATELDWTANFAAGLLLVAVYGFQGVGNTSGPWSVPNNGQFASNYVGPFTQWRQVCWTAPSATGVGLEVWCAINAVGGSFSRNLAFATSQQAQVSVAAYSGAYAPTGRISDGAVRAAVTAQVVGNNPAAPNVYANTGELVVAVGADLMTGAGFGTPSGFTSRIDAAGGGAGNAEAVIADATAVSPGNFGLITFPQPAASSSTAGTTATLAVVPAPTTATGGGVIDAPLPEELQIGEGYAIRVTAVDPTTGGLVSGVTVGTTVLTAEVVAEAAGGGGGDLGEWVLIPGIGA